LNRIQTAILIIRRRLHCRSRSDVSPYVGTVAYWHGKRIRSSWPYLICGVR
jgi:hypothetical protein